MCHRPSGATGAGVFPDRVFIPCFGVVSEVREELRSDLSMGRACRPGVDGAKHQTCASLALWCDTSIGWHTLSKHRVPEALYRGETVRRQFVEHDEHADRTCCIHV